MCSIAVIFPQVEVQREGGFGKYDFNASELIAVMLQVGSGALKVWLP